MVSMPCDVVEKKFFVSSEPVIFSTRQFRSHEIRQAIERVQYLWYEGRTQGSEYVRINIMDVIRHMRSGVNSPR